MYIRLIDSTLRENEYLFRLNDQQKVYLILSDMDNNLHFNQILHRSKTVVQKFNIRLKGYLPKGYLI